MKKKQTIKFLVPKALRYKFGGLFAMKNFMGIEKTPPAFEQSFKAAIKLKRELPVKIERESVPLMKTSRLANDIQFTQREASQNADAVQAGK